MKNLNDLLWKITNLYLNLNNLPYLTSILNISSKSKEHYIKTPVTSKKLKTLKMSNSRSYLTWKPLKNSCKPNKVKMTPTDSVASMILRSNSA